MPKDTYHIIRLFHKQLWECLNKKGSAFVKEEPFKRFEAPRQLSVSLFNDRPKSLVRFKEQLYGQSVWIKSMIISEINRNGVDEILFVQTILQHSIPACGDGGKAFLFFEKELDLQILRSQSVAYCREHTHGID
jgi:hypothetical protein